MFEIRVETEFAAAHFLQDYHGKCERLHGHNYQVFAHARGTELDKGGMLVDFGDLKGTLRTVCGELDHTNLNELKIDGTFVFQQNPSAERIAKFIFERMRALLPHESAPLLFAVDVFETSTSRARYQIE